VINESGRDDSNRKKNEVDEKFYCHILSDEPNERHEGIAKEAKEAVEEPLRSKEKNMIDDSAVIPKRNPDIPQRTENLLFGGK
jgi:hypothetical protein